MNLSKETAAPGPASQARLHYLADEGFAVEFDEGGYVKWPARTACGFDARAWRRVRPRERKAYRWCGRCEERAGGSRG